MVFVFFFVEKIRRHSLSSSSRKPTTRDVRAVLSPPPSTHIPSTLPRTVRVPRQQKPHPGMRPTRRRHYARQNTGTKATRSERRRAPRPPSPARKVQTPVHIFSSPPFFNPAQRNKKAPTGLSISYITRDNKGKNASGKRPRRQERRTDRSINHVGWLARQTGDLALLCFAPRRQRLLISRN